MAQKQQSALYATTHGHSEAVLRTHRWRTAQNSAAYLLPYLKPDMKILDVGCGPGSITVDLARIVTQGHITGVDYAQGAIDSAIAYAAAANITNVAFAQADAYALPFPDDAFDVTHAHQVLQHISDPVSALREMRRVTKPGGIVACRECDGDTFIFHPENEGTQVWIRVHQAMSRASGGEPNGGRHLLGWAREAGFERSRITCTASAWCFASAEERAFWGGVFIDRLEQSNYAASVTKAGVATPEEIESMKRGMRALIDNEDAWASLTHGEIICRA